MVRNRIVFGAAVAGLAVSLAGCQPVGYGGVGYVAPVYAAPSMAGAITAAGITAAAITAAAITAVGTATATPITAAPIATASIIAAATGTAATGAATAAAAIMAEPAPLGLVEGDGWTARRNRRRIRGPEFPHLFRRLDPLVAQFLHPDGRDVVDNLGADAFHGLARHHRRARHRRQCDLRSPWRALADQFDRFRMVLIAYAAAWVHVLGLTILAYAGALTIAPLAALSFPHGLIHRLQRPGRIRDDAPLHRPGAATSAIAVSSAYTQFAIFAGPAIAGWIIAARYGVVAAYATNVVGYLRLFCDGQFLRTPNGFVRPAPSGRSIVGDIADGMRYIAGRARISALLLLMLRATRCRRPSIRCCPQ